MFLPEVLLAARAMKAGMELLKPELSKTNITPIGKVVVGTVAGVIVGGAPVTARFASEIGSDAFAEDAGTAVVLCKKMADKR